MTIFSVYPIEIITGKWGAIQILPVPCPPLIEVALYSRAYACLVASERVSRKQQPLRGSCLL